MQHFYQNISGWFTYPNLYKQVVQTYENNSHFVEVGTWCGQSAIYMAVEIINSNKQIKFDCVDTWEGSEEHQNLDVIRNNNLYETFLANIEPVKTIIKPVRQKSLDAAKIYNDNSLDFVFIDAAHDYENVKNDIWAWYPKVKSGGMLAGHDYAPEWVDLLRAVHEFLEKEKYELSVQSENCWGIIKR
jgi:predicted O-methyltransferase YrrM